MATLSLYYSLVEQAKRMQNGNLLDICEVLDLETGMILQEAPWMPANDTWTNKSIRRASRPTGTKRKLNTGVPVSSSKVTEILDVMMMVADYAEYDKDWIDSFPNPSVARMMESRASISGIGEALVSSILYDNANADPDGMHGFAPRLATIDGKYVVDGGGTGADVTSIYVITWDPQDAFLMYPKNMPTIGVTHQNLGEVTLTDATTAVPNTSQYQGYRDYYQVKCGLVIRNPKKIGRVANIETAGATNTFDEDKLIKVCNYVKITPNTRIYANQTILTQGEIKLKDKNNVNWSPAEGLGGLPFMKFRGIPVRMIDEQLLLNTETAIT